MTNVVMGPWAKAVKHKVAPKTQAAREKADAEQLCDRMCQWAVDAEREVGIDNARKMLFQTLHWFDMRRQFKGGKP